MNKTEYLKELEAQIHRLPSSVRAEILADYEEHFSVGLAEGKSEEQIAESLGSPRSVASEILMNNLVEKARQAPSTRERAHALLRIALLFLVMAPFNFLMLVGPFLVIGVLLFTGWALPIGFVGGSFFVIGTLFQSGVMGFGILSGLALLFIFLGVLGLCGLTGMIMWLLTRAFIWVFIAYCKWNIEFITARRAH